MQLADVVVGFVDLRGLDAAEVERLPEPFDYYCWDLYGEVGRWFEEDPARQRLRRETLHALESGEGERAELGRLVARRIVRRHLATMRRLGIGYDLLTRESDILRLQFFARAFERLRESGALRLEASGKNAGCWVMPLADSAEFAGLEEPDKVDRALRRHGDLRRQGHRLPALEVRPPGPATSSTATGTRRGSGRLRRRR